MEADELQAKVKRLEAEEARLVSEKERLEGLKSAMCGMLEEDFVEFQRLTEEAQVLITSGRLDEAEELARVLDADYPEEPIGAERLAQVYEARGMSAAETPVALRSLDEEPPARKALLSFLGPGSRIKGHSDKVNFVVTLYLPLFSGGAWISFGGHARRWTDGRCMAADSSYYHESVNASDRWRGLMLVDLWHPELTEVERLVLGVAVPRINDVLRRGEPD